MCYLDVGGMYLIQERGELMEAGYVILGTLCDPIHFPKKLFGEIEDPFGLLNNVAAGICSIGPF